MIKRLATAMAVMSFAALLGGCIISGTVTALAPSREAHLNATAPESGAYTLYRAKGFDQAGEPTLERLWSVSLMHGQKLGFRWETSTQHEWDSQGGFHLIAYAGNQTRDLGPFVDRDVKYAWAGPGDDVMSYFHTVSVNRDMGGDQWNNQ